MHIRFLKDLNRRLDFDRKETVLKYLEDASSPGFDFLMLIILSCVIATFGLITNSAAVIIGAMLVAPLMSPILAFSLASVVGEHRVFRRALVALVAGAVLSIALSTLISLLFYRLPFGIFEEIPSEILSRTTPSPFDLGIAIAGGAAAAYALAQPNLSAALPGVAISTALMPPLCVIGIGISMQSSTITFGATLLFLTNLLAISFSGILVFIWLGFRPLNTQNRWRGIPRSVMISSILMLLVTVPLSLLTFNSVQQANFSKNVQNAVRESLKELPSAQLVDSAFTIENDVVNVEVTILSLNQPSHLQILNMQNQLAMSLGRTVALQIMDIPTTELNPLVPPTPTPTEVFTSTATLTTSPTVNISPTITVTASPVASATASATQTPTYTKTAMPTAVPTLATGIITGVSGSIYVLNSPAGNILFALPDGTKVYLTGKSAFANNIRWLEIEDFQGRIGWLPAKNIQVESY
jgi:uncharacterized hydrophobic protein (TIGR00271 family)